MTWSRFDDLYDDHPKVMAATHACSLAAALHPQAITAASRRESDGLVDPFWLLARAPVKKARDEALATLVRIGLFDLLPAGEAREMADAAGFSVTLGPFPDVRYLVHDYLDYNPSSAQLADRRRKESERKARGRRKESDGSPAGVRADIARNPDGPPASAPAQPQPLPIPSQSQGPPLAPPADAGGELGIEGVASLVNPRALGTNPRANGSRLAAAETAERHSLAVAALNKPSDEDRHEWERLHMALIGAVSGIAETYVADLRLVAVDGSTLVAGASPRAWTFVSQRFSRAFATVAEHLRIDARLASLDEQQGLDGTDKDEAAA